MTHAVHVLLPCFNMNIRTLICPDVHTPRLPSLLQQSFAVQKTLPDDCIHNLSYTQACTSVQIWSLLLDQN